MIAFVRAIAFKINSLDLFLEYCQLILTVMNLLSRGGGFLYNITVHFVQQILWT